MVQHRVRIIKLAITKTFHSNIFVVLLFRAVTSVAAFFGDAMSISSFPIYIYTIIYYYYYLLIIIGF